MYNRKKLVLALNKGLPPRWDIPRIPSSDKESIHVLVENYIKKNFNISYRIVGQSSVYDKYEWPKELAVITGKEGEEHRFILIKVESPFDDNSVNKNSDIKGFEFLDYESISEKIVFKNHRKMLSRIYEEIEKNEKNSDTGDKVI